MGDLLEVYFTVSEQFLYHLFSEMDDSAALCQHPPPLGLGFLGGIHTENLNPNSIQGGGGWVGGNKKNAHVCTIITLL